MKNMLHFSSTLKYWLTLYIYILFPILTPRLIEGDSHLTKRIIYNMIAALGICFPFSLLSQRFHKGFMGLFLLFYLLSWIEICHLHLFDYKLMLFSIQIILDSNVSETKEFIYNTFDSYILIMSGIFLFIILFCWYYTSKFHIITNTKNYFILITFIALIFSINKGFHSTIFSRYQLLPYRFVTSAYNYYKDKYTLIKLQKEHKVPHFTNLKSSNFSTKKETYIVIIGESADRNHLGYYGYNRPTTPFSSQDLQPIIFNNITTPHTSTMLALRDILTFSHNEHVQAGIRQGSIINIFNQAGFKSFWLSNQYSQGKYDNLTSVIANDSSVTNFINDKADYMIKNKIDSHFDEALLPELDKALQDSAPKKIIFLHLAGSHTYYGFRFPKNFDIFQENNKNSFERAFDDYDNSIRYTDYVLSQIVKRIKKRQEQSFILYFSDHGDDVSLDPKSCHCHTTNPKKQTPPMYEIPFLLWFNSTYQKNNPHLIKQIKEYTNRPFITHHLIHSLPTLAGLSFDLQDNEKNLFSPSFVPEKE